MVWKKDLKLSFQTVIYSNSICKIFFSTVLNFYFFHRVTFYTCLGLFLDFVVCSFFFFLSVHDDLHQHSKFCFNVTLA